MGVVYCCHFCHSYHTQPFGRVVEKEAPNGNINVSFKTAPGPPVNGSSCEECGSTLHVSPHPVCRRVLMSSLEVQCG
jgi:tRNA (guanine26-N2/guanine27-N2)-dimethyltransferase